jgi:DNA primase
VPANFDQNIIDQVLQGTDIVEVIGNYVALKPRGKEMLGLCPFHEDSRPSLNVSPTKQIFKCFACGAGGTAITFLMRRERMTFPEAVKLLAERCGVRLPQKQGAAAQAIDRDQLVKINVWAARLFRKQYEDPAIGEQARNYVDERKISEQTARQFGLGWTPEAWENLTDAARHDGVPMDALIHLGLVVKKPESDHLYDRFRQRLIFPVIDTVGRVIGFGGRTLGDDPAKYLNSPESSLFDKSKTLYGLNTAKDAIMRLRQAVIVEGYTDCIMAHQFGVTNVVATLGTALTPDHAHILSRYADQIVLLFDSDAAGQKAADRAMEIFFDQKLDVRITAVPEGKDPCDYLLLKGKEAFESIIAQATDALEFKWAHTMDRVEGTDNLPARNRAVNEFLALAARSIGRNPSDAIARGLILNRLAKLVNVSPEEIHTRFSQLQRRIATRRLSGRNETVDSTTEAVAQCFDSRMRSEREILEVLLNRPDLLDAAKKILPRTEDFSDPVLAAAAGYLWRLNPQESSVTLASIMSQCEDVTLCDLMTDLAENGAARGNYENTLAGAMNNLAHLRERAERAQIREVLSQSGGRFDDDVQTAMLHNIQTKCKPDLRKAGPL